MGRIPACGGRDGKPVRDRNTVQRIKDITPRSCRSKPVPKRFAAFSQGPAGEDGIQGIGAAPFILVIKIILLHLIKKADAIPGLFLNCLLKQVPDLVCQVVEVEWLIFKLDLTDLNPGHIENFVDNGQKELGKLLCLHDIVLGAVPVKLAVRQVQHTDNSV